MKSLIFGALVAVGLVVAIGDRGDSGVQDDPRIQQGVQQIDSYLAKGLTPEAHDTLSQKARASADWLKRVQQHAVSVTE